MQGFKQFFEMPLSNYKVAPFINPVINRSKQNLAINQFSKLDRKIITLDKTQNCLRKALEGHNYNFNFILMESSGGLRSEQYEEKIVEYMEENNIPRENHITFATNSSTGHPMTCWMLLHKFGHALLEENIKIKDEIHRKIVTIGRIAATNLLKFKSAASYKSISDAVTSTDELMYELVAEYLWHGKIRVGDSDNFHIKSDIHPYDFFQSIELEIQKALNNSVGKILLDYFHE